VWLLRTILFVVLLVVFVVLAVQNTGTPVSSVQFFGWKQEMVPVWIVIFGSALVGFLAGLIVSGIREIRLRLEAAKLRRERNELQKEIARLRAAPLEEISASMTPYPDGDSLP
jgi:uncharacterized integral membrane protein